MIHIFIVEGIYKKEVSFTLDSIRKDPNGFIKHIEDVENTLLLMSSNDSRVNNKEKTKTRDFNSTTDVNAVTY
jgi:hypothetical protein